MAAAKDEAELSRLLEGGKEVEDLTARIRHFARALLGRPYVSHPLIGGPNQDEALVTDVAGFDCVTYVETVLALARSRSPAAFREELVLLRYKGGSIAWRERLHYFSDWFLENARRGVLQIDTPGPGARRIEARLSLLEGLPARSTAFDVIPKECFDLAIPRIADGSIAAFASEREGLDYFHVGLLFFEAPGRLALMHAAKSAGVAGKEPLLAFLDRNSMRGISFARPLEARRTV